MPTHCHCTSVTQSVRVNSERKSRGPEVTRTGSHADRNSRGAEVTRTGSHADRKSRGPEVTRTGSHADRKSRGPEVTRTGSHADRKSRGPEVTWTGSHVDRKSRGQEVTWTGIRLHSMRRFAAVAGAFLQASTCVSIVVKSINARKNYANADVFSRLKYGGHQPGGRPLLPPA